jgi:rhodanese-related sulfurtransferase
MRNKKKTSTKANTSVCVINSTPDGFLSIFLLSKLSAMVNKFCLPVILLITIAANGQFKNDNLLYKTVDPADLCATLEKNKGYILLDVRTPGEYADTSMSQSYNLGHLKGARNIDVGELGKRLSEIKEYKNKPVFVYCSHSQRSRRANKMLADSGFTNLFNINGGMTAIYYTDAKEKGCLKTLVETNNRYDIISANELCKKQSLRDNVVFVMDVRTDSAFRHISRDTKENAMGVIRWSVNIPLADLPGRMSEVPKGSQEIIVTDIYGDEAAKAAVLLKQNGYAKVSILIEGVDRILYTDAANLACRNDLYVSPLSYQTITVSEFGKYAKGNNNFILLDVRTADEFLNRHKDYWRNIGHITGAINIPVADLSRRFSELDKNKEVLIYAFGSGKDPFEAANALQKLGFKKLKVIYGGVFNMRWTAGNVKGQSYLKDMVVDIPEINQ